MTEIILDLNRRIGALMTEVQALQIKDDAGYNDADIGMSKSLNIEKKIIEHFEEKKSEPVRNWESLNEKNWADILKALREQETTMLGHLKTACSLITIKMANYKTKRVALDRERREAAQKEHEKAIRVEAFEMAEAGIPQHAIDAVIEQEKTEVDLNPLPELRGKTKLDFDWEIKLIPGEDDLILKHNPNLLIPTTEGMKKALIAKIKSVVKATNVPDIPGVDIRQVPSSRRQDLK